jgi:hypothetical protein
VEVARRSAVALNDNTLKAIDATTRTVLAMTDDTPIREPDQIRQDCARKLRAVQISDHFQAILGCLLGEDWTTPRLVEMVITPDGHLLGRCGGEAAFKAFLGASEDLIKNIHGVARSPSLMATRSASSWRKSLRSKGRSNRVQESICCGPHEDESWCITSFRSPKALST